MYRNGKVVSKLQRLFYSTALPKPDTAPKILNTGVSYLHIYTTIE